MMDYNLVMEERKMTDKKFASLKEPARKEADKIVLLKNIEDAANHFKNISLHVAQGMLRQWGWYACIWNHADGTKEKAFYEIAV